MTAHEAFQVSSELWSPLKQQHLHEQLEGFWKQDEWVMSECPLVDRATYAIPFALTIRFTCSSPGLTTEMKYVFWRKFQDRVWRAQTWRQHVYLKRLVAWLNQIAPHLPSFLFWSHEKWEMSFRSYLVEQGLLQEDNHTSWRLDRRQQPHFYPRHDHSLSLLHVIYSTLQVAYDDREEYDKEVWDMRKLTNYAANSNSNYLLNFTNLSPSWLTQAAKKYIRYHLTVMSYSHCQNRLKALRHFSDFLQTSFPALEAAELNRSILLHYLTYLSKCDLTATTHIDYLVGLRSFLEWCVREGWAEVPEKQLIYKEDFPQKKRPQPRWIPEEVLAQLNEHVDRLPSFIMRMVLILQECGMRLGELCTLAFDCLSQDTTGDWFLR